MLRFALVALLATAACRLSLEDGDSGPSPGDSGLVMCQISTAPACVEAAANPAASAKLSWIETNIFSANCGTASCHGPVTGGTPGGGVALTTASHDKLVNVDSTLAVGRKLVVPGSVARSYLMVIMRHLQLSEADPSPAPAPTGDRYMPLNNPPVCCQKLDALAAWIAAGALNN